MYDRIDTYTVSIIFCRITVISQPIYLGHSLRAKFLKSVD